MNSNVDVKVVLFGLLLQAQDERRLGDGLAQVVRFIGRTANVVGGFRKEKSLWLSTLGQPLFIVSIDQEDRPLHQRRRPS